MTSSKDAKVLPARDVAFRAALAGGIAGMGSNFLLHPLDTVKTLRQHNPKEFKGTLRSMGDIVRKDGIIALYRGVVPGAVGAMPSSMLYFGTYEFVKSSLLRRIPRDRFRQLSPLANMVSAACGNTASSIIFVPKEVLKQKMQAAGAAVATAQVAAVAGPPAASLGAVLAATIEAEGISGLYRGYASTLLRNIPSTALNFCAYEQLKLAIIWRRHLRRRREREEAGEEGEEAAYEELVDVRGRELAPWQHTAIGCASGAFSAFLTTPMDVVKTRFATGRIARGTSISGALRQVAREDGVRGGLFAGLNSRLLWSSLFSACAFPIYERAKSLLFVSSARPATAAPAAPRPAPPPAPPAPPAPPSSLPAPPTPPRAPRGPRPARPERRRTAAPPPTGDVLLLEL
eukprot:tig00000769_g4038.t1